jgi:hypothetical protein
MGRVACRNCYISLQLGQNIASLGGFLLFEHEFLTTIIVILSFILGM